MTNEMNHWIIKRWELLKLNYGYRCFFCESKENLEFAHLTETELNGRGRGRKERYYDIIQNPDSYLLLCQKGHRKMDRKKKKNANTKTTSQ